jgi:hypothetical protein
VPKTVTKKKATLVKDEVFLFHRGRTKFLFRSLPVSVAGAKQKPTHLPRSVINKLTDMFKRVPFIATSHPFIILCFDHIQESDHEKFI